MLIAPLCYQEIALAERGVNQAGAEENEIGHEPVRYCGFRHWASLYFSATSLRELWMRVLQTIPDRKKKVAEDPTG